MQATDADQFIRIRGAREHNLRDVTLALPKGQLICMTGVSGSGKSSLAFDTLYAEGQRRYIESLSSYARQFMGQMTKPDVDALSGLSPSISIEQKAGGGNPRSTVGTITEIHDYLRVLFARVGTGHCPQCDRPIEAQSREQILARLLDHPAKTRLTLLAPVVVNQKGAFKDLFADLAKRGFVRARIDGETHRLADKLDLDRQMRHNIEVVVDRLAVSAAVRPRLAEAVEQTLKLSGGAVLALVGADETGLLLSAHYSCASCGLSFEPPSPQMFSFNSPMGMCRVCDGMGEQTEIDPDLLVPDAKLSVKKGAVELVGTFKGMGRWRKHIYAGVAEHLGLDLDAKWRDVPEEARKGFLYGTGRQHVTFAWRSRGRTHHHGEPWEGVIPAAMAKYRQTSSPLHRAKYEKYLRVRPCSACGGERLNPQARHVRVGGKTLVELEAMPIDELAAFFAGPVAEDMTDVQLRIAGEAVKEIAARLGFLTNVGLHYLSLDRRADTLSGGESQRIRLSGQIGSGLVGVTYVLDEPSIGLHARDNAKLIATLQRLRDAGNTVVVVEHDEDTMRAADHVIDFGPGPGVRGGRVVAEGALREVLKSKDSLTAAYLRGDRTIAVPTRRPISLEGRPS